MRVIHFADIHIGVERYGQPVPGKGWLSHTEDILRAFDYLVDYALESGTDAVIFAGDAFKTRDPSQTQQREFASRIRRLADAGIAVMLLTGNHDVPNAEGRAHALELYRILDVPGVTVGDDAWFVEQGGPAPHVLETRAGPLQVATIPWPRPSKLLEALPGGTNMTTDQVTRQMEKEIEELVARQTERLDRDIPAILTGHLTVNSWQVDTQTGTEALMTMTKAPQVLPSALRPGAFDYVAMGHHHNIVDLEMETPGWYAGSLQPIDFGDVDKPKGFIELEIDTKQPPGKRVTGSGIPRVVDVPQRKFITVQVGPAEADPTAEVCAAIDEAEIRDNVVRVEIHVSRDQDQRLSMGRIEEALLPAHFVASTRVHTPVEQRTKLPPGVQPDAASPIEVLDLYLRAREVEGERRQRLVSAAETLLASVEIEETA